MSLIKLLSTALLSTIFICLLVGRDKILCVFVLLKIKKLSCLGKSKWRVANQWIPKPLQSASLAVPPPKCFSGSSSLPQSFYQVKTLSIHKIFFKSIKTWKREEKEKESVYSSMYSFTSTPKARKFMCL